jgi:hypothetical protein
MAKPAPKPVTSHRPAVRPKPRPGLLGPTIFTSVTVLLAMTAMPVCILLIAGMIPSITAYVVDRTPRRMLTLTVASLNFAGTVPFCARLWFVPDGMRTLAPMLAEPWVWMVMYLAAAAGWLLHFAMPPIVTLVLERSLDMRKAKYLAIQQRLEAEWGPEVNPAEGEEA